MDMDTGGRRFKIPEKCLATKENRQGCVNFVLIYTELESCEKTQSSFHLRSGQSCFRFETIAAK